MKKNRKAPVISFDFTHPSGKPYALCSPVCYLSERYKKHVFMRAGYRSDGATGGSDVVSLAWFVHDKLCETGVFRDGTPCTVWQASRILSDILHEEGRHAREKIWFLPTLLFGGGKCRDNGIFWRKK